MGSRKLSKSLPSSASPVDTEFEALPSAVMFKGTHCGPQEDAAKTSDTGKSFCKEFGLRLLSALYVTSAETPNLALGPEAPHGKPLGKARGQIVLTHVLCLEQEKPMNQIWPCPQPELMVVKCWAGAELSTRDDRDGEWAA